jgi:putative transposase
MPDHLHLFAAFAPGSTSLSDWMRALKRTLAKHWSARGGPSPAEGLRRLTAHSPLRPAGGEGAYWQKGFFDHVLRSEESYEEKWQYVRQNPVRAGLVQSAEDWPYQGEIQRFTVGAW